jgi:MFS transporter, CP family, cyanate transporter
MNQRSLSGTGDPLQPNNGPDEDQHRWMNLALIWLLYFSFGMVIRAIAPLVTPILKDLQLSYTQMGFILGSWQLTYILTAILAGTIIDKWGVRKSLMAGTIVIGLSSVLRYFPRGFEGMLGAVLLFGAGGSMISVGCPKAIFLWFTEKDRGTAVGIYLTGAWLGGIFSLTCTNSLIMPLMGHSWRSTFAIYGLFTFITALLWWLFVREKESRVSREESGILEVFYRLIRVRNVQVVLTLGFFSFIIIHGFSNWLPKFLEINGLSPSLAGVMAATSLAAGVPALLIIPRLIPTPFRGRFLALSAFLTMASLVIVFATSGMAQMMGLVLFGFISSPIVSILTLTLMDTPEVGSEAMGSAVGMFFCIAETGGFTGPLIIGALIDFTGAFLAGTILLVVLCLAFSGLTLLLKT